MNSSRIHRLFMLLLFLPVQAFRSLAHHCTSLALVARLLTLTPPPSPPLQPFPWFCPAVLRPGDRIGEFCQTQSWAATHPRTRIKMPDALISQGRRYISEHAPIGSATSVPARPRLPSISLDISGAPALATQRAPCIRKHPGHFVLPVTHWTALTYNDFQSTGVGFFSLLRVVLIK